MAGLGAPGRMRFGEQRRRARDEQAHMRGRFPRHARVLDEPDIESRHAHQAGGARQRRDDRVGVETRLEDHRRAAEQRDIGGDEQAMRMKNRQRMDQNVGAGEAPDVDQRARVGGEIVMRQHRAFRASGRA